MQIDWTADHRGRLFQNPTGYANKEHVHYGLHNDRYILEVWE